MNYPRQTFESFLRDIHAKAYSGTDDDMPDHFDNWLGDLDGDDFMEYAELYGNIEYVQGRQSGLIEAKEIISA